MSVPPPNEKKLRIASFAVHSARGLVRDQEMRRRALFVLTLTALLLLFCGATFLNTVLDSHSRPGWFIFYWTVVAWITCTIFLLAIFDLLMVRAKGRRKERELARKLRENEPDDHA